MKQWISTLLGILLVGAGAVGGWLYTGKQEVQNQLVDLQQNYDALQSQTQDATQSQADLNKALSKAQAQLKTQKGQVVKLEAQLEGLQGQKKRLENTLQTKTQAFDQKSRQYDGLQLLVQTKEQDLDRQQQAQQEKALQLNRLQDRLDQLAQTLEGKDQDLVQALSVQQRLEKEQQALKATHVALVAQLKEEIKNSRAVVSASKTQVKVTLLDQILFGSAQASISDEGQTKLAKIGTALKSMTSGRIRVAGHTDNVPINPDWQYRFPSNWELSAARAAAVARYFMEQSGIDPELVEVVGFASHRPAADNGTEAGRRQNRRVEILLEGS